MDEIFWIWFSKLTNISNKIKNRLLEEYKTPERIWNLDKKELMKVEGIGEKIADIILNSKNKLNLENELQYIKNNNISIINIEDESYPKLLKQIYDPPICLYIKGDTQILNDFSLAIIGCRQCSNYGSKIAKDIAYSLAKKDINIVSGLARGIDTFAHIGAVNGNGKTIAVVGTGLDIVYPYQNKILEENIVKKGGAIVSEYPLGTKPIKTNFPERNRIISGLSKGVIVVEAKEKSGTLITVDFALEQGRNVYVVPGNINSKNSVGTNELIKEGAKPITKLADILEDFYTLG